VSCSEGDQVGVGLLRIPKIRLQSFVSATAAASNDIERREIPPELGLLRWSLRLCQILLGASDLDQIKSVLGVENL
jgi:hypothetical protein